MRRIVCIGNRYIAGDDAGPRVHDLLALEALPEGVELIDAGLAGLDLLRLLEASEQVIFVDAVSGFAEPDAVVVLDATTVAAQASLRCDHAAGLPYALSLAPRVCDDLAPDVRLVGVERPASDDAVARARRTVMAIVRADPAPSAWAEVQ